MTISKIDFCNSLLLEHFKPSGPINQLTQIRTENNRPYIQGNIVEGFRIDSLDRVKVELEGIVLAPTSNTVNKSSFSFDCFEVNCFESTLEETNINVSKICKQTIQVTNIVRELNGEIILEESIVPLRTPNDIPEVTYKRPPDNYILNIPTIEIKQRALEFNSLDPLQVCDLDSEGFPIYYARGEKDIEGNMYFADFGYIAEESKDFITTEQNIPFSLAPLNNVLRAISSEPLPREIKAVRIKRLKNNSLETIGLIYGQLEDQFYFPHQTIQFNRDFDNQDIYLEDLSINLLLYMGIKSAPQKENTILYKNKYYSTPEIEFVIKNSFNTLSSLVNSIADIPQNNSIPNVFKSYTKSDSEYNSFADQLYLKEPSNCFEDDCFSEECFKPTEVNNLINRSIKNKSIGWAILAFSSYIVNYNRQEFIQTIENLIQYLLNQKNNKGLFYSGWEDTLLKDTYENSLELDSKIETSTNIIILLALLKAFEVTQDFNYILEACLLHTNINKYLATPNNTFKHSYNETQESIESSIYTLIYSNILRDYKKVEPTIKFLDSNLFVNDITDETTNVIKEIDNVVNNLDNVIIDNLLEEDSLNQLFKKTELDTYETELEVLKINYLAFISITTLSNSFEIPFFNKLTSLSSLIESRLERKREEATSLFSAACLINNISLFDITSNNFKSIVDFNNYKFTKDLLFDKLIKTIPVNYSWASPEVLTPNSNIGALLYSVACAEALNVTRKEFIKRMSSISYMYGVLLNTKAEDFGISRIPKEPEEDLKERIKLEITLIANTKNDIEFKLNYYDTAISIKDNYQMIQAFSGPENTFTTNWGEGFLSGTEKASTVLYTINIYQPLEQDALDIIKNLAPAGIKYKFNEILRFSIGGANCGLRINNQGSQEGCIGFRLTKEDFGCSNIDLENGADFANESRGRICLEDSESNIEQPPVVVEPTFRILTNFDEPLIDNDGNYIEYN